MPTKCLVHGCTKPAVANGLCDTHRKRVERHGSVEQTRPSDWGRREKHPAYGTWCNLRRYHKKDIPEHWRDDFWAFAAEIPTKPEQRCMAQRPDQTIPWGRDNFFWKESTISPEARESKAAYMREWQRKVRAANRDYGKDSDLRKNYGVTLEWYKAKHAEQNGRCAICGNEETAVIRGRSISLAVDHCHETGKVRGLLCRLCNNAIGALKHDPALLTAAIAYLVGNQETQ